MTSTNQVVVEEQVIAGIMYKHNGGMKLIYNNQPRSALEIAQVVKEYIDNNHNLLSMGNYDIALDDVYAVFDFDSDTVEVINKDNKPTDMLDFSKIDAMSDKQLKDAFSTAIDFVARMDVEDSDYLDNWLDSIDEVFAELNKRYTNQKQLLQHYVTARK